MAKRKSLASDDKWNRTRPSLMKQNDKQTRGSMRSMPKTNSDSIPRGSRKMKKVK